MIHQHTGSDKREEIIRVWGRVPRIRFRQRLVDIVQHICVIAAFLLFLSYVQTVTANEQITVFASESGYDIDE